MNKAYNKITWQNKPSTATPLNQTNLNEMSNALDTIDDRVIALDSGKVGSVTVTNTLQTGDTIATITVDGTATNIKSAQVEVDEEPSATSANPLQNKAIYEMLNNLLPEGSESGNPISIDDASGLDAKACSVDLLPIQDLHGYDSPWVGGAGINKLANLKDGTYEGNGVKAVVKDGVATLSGTTTSSGNAIIIPLDKAVTVPNQTCYLHSMNSVQNGSVQPSIEKNGDAPNTAIAFAFTPTNRITEIPQTRYGVTVDQVRFYLGSGVTLSGTFSPMICLTNTATDFAPYENICPISGRTELNLAVRDVNQWDEEWENGSINDNTGENATGTTIRSKNYISVVPNTSYYFHVGSGSAMRVFFYGIDKTYLSRIDTGSTTFTVPTNAYYMRFRAFNAYGTTYNHDISINYPSTDTAYEPYQGSTVTVQFGQTVYGGTLDVTNGKLTIDKEYRLFNGTENWQVNGTGTDHYFYYINLGSADYAIQGDIISDKFTTVSVSQYNTTVGTIFCTPQYIRVRPFSTEVSVSDWKTWLQSNNVQVVFGIQTPIEITLTAEQISLLKGNNVISTDGDNINLIYSKKL